MRSERSPIEQMFKDACSDKGVSFDEEEQVSRYRVDFIDESRKLIIELDGHESHKSKEDRTYDAKRDRQLQREGYTVIRFTGSEIYKNSASCVDEVLQITNAIEPGVIPDGALYIDWQFFCRRVSKKYHEYSKEQIEVDIADITTKSLFSFLAKYLQLEGLLDVHLFGVPSSFSKSLVKINTFKSHEFNNSTLRIFEHQNEWLLISLAEHLHMKGTIYKKLYLVADDPILKIELDKGREIDAIIRLDGQETNLIEAKCKQWQDIDYIVGTLFGLQPHQII